MMTEILFWGGVVMAVYNMLIFGWGNRAVSNL